MIFDRNNHFLTLRAIILSLGITVFFTIGNLFVFKETSLYSSLLSVRIYVIITILFLLFAMTHTVELKDKSLIKKNIYGVVIKEIKIKSIKGRKVTHRSIRGHINIFGKKYNQLIQVKYNLVKGRYAINGHILSSKGLKLLLAKTKN